MGDTLSIKQAVEQATSTLNKEATDEAPAEVVVDEVDGGDVEESPESEPVEELNTPTQDEQPDDDDSDFERIDPKTLPKELQGVYKNLLKGFTQGRQKDSERANKLEKDLAELKAKLETPQKEAETPKFDTPEEYYSYIAEQKARETIQNERVTSYREQAVKDYPKLDPRLDDKAETYDEVFDKVVGAELDARLADHIKETGTEVGFDYKASFEVIKSKWDGYVDGNVKKYLQKQGEIAKKSEAKLRKSTPKTSVGSTSPTGIKSISDAIKAAREQLSN